MENETIQLILRDIIQRSDLLTEWEHGFISDIEDKVLKGHDLSLKQMEKIDQIYERVTENG